MSVRKAFNEGAKNYDSTREKLIPCFDDFYGIALELIPFNRVDKIKILDLGAGTGLFSYFVSQRYPNAELTLYDISDKMLEEAKKRFSTSNIEIKYIVKDYCKEPIEGKFDLVISALSIHHLTNNGKENLFKKLFPVINDNGIFINADQALGETPGIEKVYRKSWLSQVKASDIDDDSLSSALERLKEDKMSTLSDQLLWLKNAGFSEINCWYQNYSFVVYSGKRL